MLAFLIKNLIVKVNFIVSRSLVNLMAEKFFTEKSKIYKYIYLNLIISSDKIRTKNTRYGKYNKLNSIFIKTYLFIKVQRNILFN
jgi:hypothetical protein